MTAAPPITLAAFLLERIAEDEADAQAAGGHHWQSGRLTIGLGPDPYVYSPEHGNGVIEGSHVCVTREDTIRGGGPYRFDPNMVCDVYPRDTRRTPHIVRNDPARVLAECEAKRRIVERHHADGDWGDMPGVCPNCNREPWPCPTLRLLALPYADHPAYRPEWRP